MAAILVNYVATDANTGVTLNLTGMLSYADRGVGGGPIFPPSDAHPEHPIVLPPQQPPSIWPGGKPTHPIVLPGDPSWPGTPPSDAHPEHPIVLPPPNIPVEPPPGGTKPPPAGEAGWGYYDGRWGYFPGPGEAQPKRG